MDDEGEARLKATFCDNYPRLAALKRKYDPAEPLPGQSQYLTGDVARRSSTPRKLLFRAYWILKARLTWTSCERRKCPCRPHLGFPDRDEMPVAPA
ncbi:hypothetical protein [Mesorhizobium kowhaii]|uniref:hypothetical protein n=1 Tax=Mesorhizobium kowhaii TaxID=1300272 RepID=UPI001FE1CC13|nr:hypothetical protein [Mesorhizobium kowhaii]